MKKSIALVVIATIMSLSALAPAQDLTKLVSPTSDEARPRTVKKAAGKDAVATKEAAGDARPINPTEAAPASDEAAIQAQINSVYQSFYNGYRLGPGDIIGIHIDKHPDDSVEKVTVSPVG